MAAQSLSVTCMACKAKFKVGEKHWGKSGKCPNCDAPITFPAPEGYKRVSQKRVRIECEHCGKPMALPVSASGKTVKCRKCGRGMRVDMTRLRLEPAKKSAGAGGKKQVAKKSATVGTEEDLEILDNDNPRRSDKIDYGDRRAKNAWNDMQKSKEDSYWVALWRAFLYPWRAFGALIFFVVGVPLSLLLIELIAKAVLMWGGGMFGGEEYASHRTYFSAGVVALGLAGAVAMFSFFCSFLFAVVRTSAAGRLAIPVIEGMNHRSNLAAMLAWATVYFGPALLIGHQTAPEGEIFAWSPPTMIALAVFSILAPMGFLCQATVSAVAGLDPIRVVRGIFSIIDRYAYCLLVLAISAGLFLALGVWVGGEASAAMSGENASYAVGIPLRIASGLLLMFPLVIAARCLGLVVKYNEKKLPFDLDLNSEHKASIVPQLLALGGAVLLFMPLYAGAKTWTEQGGVALRCYRQLEDMYGKRLRDSGRQKYPADEAQLRKIVGDGFLTSPAFPDEKDFYKLFPGLTAQVEKDAPRVVWIYESKPTYPDGETLNVLLLNGEVTTLKESKLKDLLKIQEKIVESTSDRRREQLYRDYMETFKDMGLKPVERREDVQ